MPKMNVSHSIAAAILSFVAAQHLTAQQILPDSMLKPVAERTLLIAGPRTLQNATRFVLPTVILHVNADGAPRATALTARTTTTVSTEYQVLGLRREFVEETAGYVQAELARMLRAKNLEVLLFEDVKGGSAIPKLATLEADTMYGTPVLKENGPRTTYATVAPSLLQLFAGDPLKKHLKFAELARETQAVVLIPELWFNSPQTNRALGSPGRTTATINVGEGMDLTKGGLFFITPRGESGSITLAVPLANVSADAGTMLHTEADSNATRTASGITFGSTYLGLSYRGVFARNQSNSYAFGFAVKEEHYGLGLLVGAMSFLNAAVTIVDRERQRR